MSVEIDDDTTCVWWAIEVDEYKLELKDLAIKIAKQELPVVLCRRKSGGLHIYMFLSEPVAASMVQRKLRQIAAAIGYGQVEIFPKQTKLLLDRGDRGSTLNMPYFGGENATRYAYGLDGKALTPDDFLDHCESVALDHKALESLEASPLTESVQWLDQ